MTLPFSKYNGKRQFACFICGVVFSSFKEFCEHVTSTHEEGREWVKCPLERCQAPVRCIRSHFRSIHPYDVIPKNCQMKALIWKDVRDISKRKKKVSFEEGWFPSGKNKKNLHYNSGWERSVYEVLEKMTDVVRYEVEPVAIEYYFQGKTKNYLPDLKIHFSDGRKEFWEIKPASQTDQEINKAKWEACAHFCQKRGWEFKVITEVGIDRLKHQLRLDLDDSEED